MNLEIEIKLSPVLASQAAQVFADSAVAPYLLGEERIRMRTEYFDTASNALAALEHTLRIRRENGRPICTLKGPGPGGARTEISLEAATLTQGLEGLLGHGDVPGEVKALLEKEAFAVTCGATFVRTLRRYRREGQEYDISFDEGQLERGGRAIGLSELEIELVSGDAGQMRALAQALMDRYRLTEERDSKHKRAMALGESAVGKTVSPYFIGSEMLNFCVKKGYLLFEVGEDKKLHYTLTALGEKTLTTEFGVNFSKPCAMTGEDGDE